GRFVEKLDSLFDMQRKMDGDFLREHLQLGKNIIESETQVYYTAKRISHLLFNGGELNMPIEQLQVPFYAVTNESAEYLKYLHWYINNKQLQTREERMNNRIKFAKIDSLFPKVYADLIKLQVSSKDLPDQLEINKEILQSTEAKWVASYLGEEN